MRECPVSSSDSIHRRMESLQKVVSLESVTPGAGGRVKLCQLAQKRRGCHSGLTAQPRFNRFNRGRAEIGKMKVEMKENIS